MKKNHWPISVVVFFLVLSSLSLIDNVCASTCLWRLTTNKNTFQIGEVMALTCNYTGNDNPSLTTNVSIVDPNDDIIQSTQITPRTLVATRNISQCSQSGTYFCKSDSCGRTLRNSQTIEVRDVSEKPPLECIYNHYIDARANISCTWRPNCPGNRYKWILRYKNEESNLTECSKTDPFSTSCGIPSTPGFFEERYMIELTLIGWHLTRTYNYTIYTNNNILRMDVRLKQIVQVSSSELNVTLRLSDTKENTVCQLIYTSEWETGFTTVNYTFSYLPTLTVMLPLQRLEPFTEYTVHARCKPAESLYWSLHTESKSAKTLPDVPSEIPQNIQFADEIDTSGRRHIYLYWIPVPRRLRHGKCANYMVTYTDGHGQRNTENFPADTITEPMTATFDTNSTIQLDIGATNEAGVSMNTSVLKIMPYDFDESLQPVVNSGQDSSNMTVFWNGRVLQSGHWSLTYYWCHCPSKVVILPKCETPLESFTTNTSEFIIDTNAETQGPRYFGVSFHNGNALDQRIIWSKCTFTDSLNDEVQSMLFTASRLNSSTIRINLHRDYCDFHTMPLLYQVGMESIGVNCSQDSKDYDNFTAAPSVRNLYAKTTNHEDTSVCFRVLFNNGEIGESSITLQSLFGTDDGTDTTLIIVVGVTVAVGIILTIVMVKCVLRFRERLTKVSKIDIEDILPSISQKHSSKHVDTNKYATTTMSDGHSGIPTNSTTSIINRRDISRDDPRRLVGPKQNKTKRISSLESVTNIRNVSSLNNALSSNCTEDGVLYEDAITGIVDGLLHQETDNTGPEGTGDSLAMTLQVPPNTVTTTGVQRQSDRSSSITTPSIPENDIDSYTQINIQRESQSVDFAGNASQFVVSYTKAIPASVNNLSDITLSRPTSDSNLPVFAATQPFSLYSRDDINYYTEIRSDIALSESSNNTRVSDVVYTRSTLSSSLCEINTQMKIQLDVPPSEAADQCVSCDSLTYPLSSDENDINSYVRSCMPSFSATNGSDISAISADIDAPNLENTINSYIKADIWPDLTLSETTCDSGQSMDSYTLASYQPDEFKDGHLTLSPSLLLGLSQCNTNTVQSVTFHRPSIVSQTVQDRILSTYSVSVDGYVLATNVN